MNCPDENTLLDLIEGGLGETERIAILEHSHDCDTCRELVAALVRSSADVASPASATSSLDRSVGEAQARSESRLLAHGMLVGRYTIDTLLGSGGLGLVYAAHDPELGRRVALKLLKASGDEVRLVREARALARISHPNVVAVHDVGQWQDRVFIAMELVEGSDLRAWLAERPRRPRDIVDVFLAAGRGLAAAHMAGLVHRDFKPENVLIGRDGKVSVTDFGLARAAGSDEAPATGAVVTDVLESPHTHAGTLLGTPAYMAPEQHLGEPADARADQFAFCVALWEALEGVRPFAGDDYETLRANVCAGQLRAPRRMPATLRRILARGLSPRHAERWPSMAALLAALGRDRRRFTRRVAAVALAVLAVVVTALLGDGVVRSRQTAVTRTAFAAAGRDLERTLASRYETFASLADLSMLLPMLREAAASRDQSDFGLGSAAGDTDQIGALHGALRDADWGPWASLTRRGAVAVADYKGRLIYTTADPDAYGADLRALGVVEDAYGRAGDGAGAEVVAADDPRLAAAHLVTASDATARSGRLVILFARPSAPAGITQVAFVEVIAAHRFLEDLAADPELHLALVSGTRADGDVAPSLLAAARGPAGQLVDADDDGVPWLVQRHALPGLRPGEDIATLVMAHRADAGLAGLFPHAAELLLGLGAIAALVFAWAGLRLRSTRALL